jgi:hypothetical protein
MGILEKLLSAVDKSHHVVVVVAREPDALEHQVAVELDLIERPNPARRRTARTR